MSFTVRVQVHLQGYLQVHLQGTSCLIVPHLSLLCAPLCLIMSHRASCEPYLHTVSAHPSSDLLLVLH